MSEFLTPFLQGLFYGVIGALGYAAEGPKQGLAFGVKWSEIVKADDDQLKLFAWLDEHDPHHVPCGCYDGGAA